MVDPLGFDQLRKVCDTPTLKCASSEEMKPLEAIIGQERAVRALRFGLGMKDLGFNVYVAGIPGTGKTTAVKRFLLDEAKDKPVPNDLCYVNNFQDPSRPKALTLPPGKAREFQHDMKGLVEDGQREIRKAFESEEYAARREESLKGVNQERDALFSRMNEKAQEEGFVLQSTPIGLLTIPVVKGRPLGEQELQAVPPEVLKEISTKRDRLQEEIKATLRQVKALEKTATQRLHELDRQVGLFSFGHLIEDLKEKYAGLPRVIACLEEVQKDILENLSEFRAEPDGPQQSLFSPPGAKEAAFKKYEVNVLVDNGSLSGRPVIIELNPTYNQLFGRIDKEAQFGTLVTDFTMITEGSLHRANGGYLVIPVEELLTNLFSYEGLKRALRNQEITTPSARNVHSCAMRFKRLSFPRTRLCHNSSSRPVCGARASRDPEVCIKNSGNYRVQGLDSGCRLLRRLLRNDVAQASDRVMTQPRRLESLSIRAIPWFHRINA